MKQDNKITRYIIRFLHGITIISLYFASRNIDSPLFWMFMMVSLVAVRRIRSLTKLIRAAKEENMTTMEYYEKYIKKKE